MRPVLSPTLRRLWRDETTLQLGVSPRHAVVLTGVDAAVARFLDLLDGTRDARGVAVDAQQLGLDSAAVTELLDILDSCRALDDAAADHEPLARMERADRDRLAPDLAAISLQHGGLAAALAVLRRRRSAAVQVVGAGRVGSAVAMLLAASGVGRVVVDDEGTVTPADLGPGGLCADHLDRPRASALRDLLAATYPSVLTAAPAGDAVPQLVVHAPRDGQPLAATTAAPQLVATVRETTGTVGPLVIPGESCCLHCLDLHRTERDPHWPTLRAQLTGGRWVDACDTTLATQVAAATAAAATRWLDTGSRDLVATSYELSLDDWRWRRRSWAAHPDCGCIRPPAGAAA